MYKLSQYCYFTRLKLCERFYTAKQLTEQLCLSSGAIRYAIAHKDGDFSKWVPNARIVKVNSSDLPNDTLTDDQGIPFKFASYVNG